MVTKPAYRSLLISRQCCLAQALISGRCEGARRWACMWVPAALSCTHSGCLTCQASPAMSRPAARSQCSPTAFHGGSISRAPANASTQVVQPLKIKEPQHLDIQYPATCPVKYCIGRRPGLLPFKTYSFSWFRARLISSARSVIKDKVNAAMGIGMLASARF